MNFMTAAFSSVTSASHGALQTESREPCLYSEREATASGPDSKEVFCEGPQRERKKERERERERKSERGRESEEEEVKIGRKCVCVCVCVVGRMCELVMGREGGGRLAVGKESELHTPLISACNLSGAELRGRRESQCWR